MTDADSNNFDDNDSDNWTNDIDGTNGGSEGGTDDMEGEDRNTQGGVNSHGQNHDSLDDPDKWEGYNPQPGQSETDEDNKRKNDGNSEARRTESSGKVEERKVRKGGDKKERRAKNEEKNRSTEDCMLLDKIMRGSFEKYVIFTGESFCRT